MLEAPRPRPWSWRARCRSLQRSRAVCRCHCSCTTEGEWTPPSLCCRAPPCLPTIGRRLTHAPTEPQWCSLGHHLRARRSRGLDGGGPIALTRLHGTSLFAQGNEIVVWARASVAWRRVRHSESMSRPAPAQVCTTRGRNWFMALLGWTRRGWRRSPAICLRWPSAQAQTSVRLLATLLLLSISPHSACMCDCVYCDARVPCVCDVRPNRCSHSVPFAPPPRPSGSSWGGMFSACVGCV